MRHSHLPFVHLLILLACCLSPSLRAHQGALHPTGLDPCEDALLALKYFGLSGPGVAGASSQPILEPQTYRLLNIAKPTEIPYSVARLGFTLGAGHQGGYRDYLVRVVLPSGVHEFSASNLRHNWHINPLIEGWSGTMLVTITNVHCGFTMMATADWSFVRPGQLRNPCDPCRDLTCASRATIGSVNVEIPLGPAQFGSEPVTLRYKSENLTNEGAGKLEIEAPGENGPIITRNGSNEITSVRCGDQLTRITTEAGTEDPRRIVIRVSSDHREPAKTVYREAVIENLSLDGTSALCLSESVAGKTHVRYYTEPREKSWVLTENNLRRTTRSILSESSSTRLTHWLVEERDAGGTWTKVEERHETETHYPWGWSLTKQTIDPGGAALTSEWDYYDEGEFTGPNADESGYGRLQRELLPTGLERTFEYHDQDPFNSGFTRVEITREAFADRQGALEKRRHVSSDGTTLSELHETLIDGTLVGKTEIRASISGPAPWREERRYPAAGGPPVLTRREFDSSANNPLLERTFFPDGTIEQIAASEDGGLKTITVHRGVPASGAGLPIVRGREIRTVLNQVGQTVQTETCAIRDGTRFPIEMRLATAIDALGRPTATEVFHGGKTAPTYTEHRSFGCCGIAALTGQDGLTTFFHHDPLGRLRKVHRAGLSTETIHDGLTVHTHRYPEPHSSAQSLAQTANKVGHATRDLAGHPVERASRSPHDGSLVTTTFVTRYRPGEGLGRRVIQTLPVTPDDGGVEPTITEEYYLDGRLRQRSGPPVVDTRFTHGHTAQGPLTTISFLEGTTPRQPVTTQLDWMGRALKTTYAGDTDADGSPDEEHFTYDQAGRRTSWSDPDGVTTLYHYDVENALTRTAIDLNRNGALDLDQDEVRTTRKGVALNEARDVILWQEVSVRETGDSGHGVDTVLHRIESTADLLQSWSHTHNQGKVASGRTATTYHPDSPGSWSTTTHSPDGSSQVREFEARLLVRETFHSAASAQLLTRTFTHDAQRRLVEIRDTSGPTVRRTYLSALLDTPHTMTRGGRTTSYSYDARGRRTAIDEPDSIDPSRQPVNNRQLISYWPHGGVREITGTPGYRHRYTYDFAHRPATLTTFGTTPATTRWEYCPDRGWLTTKLYQGSQTHPAAGNRFRYTAAGRLHARTGARNITSTNRFGSDGRLTSTTYSDATASTVIHDRDRRGRITRLTDAAGTRRFRYNDLDQLTSTTWEEGALLAGWTIHQARNTEGRLTALELERGDTSRHHIAYRYDPAGRLESVESHDLRAHHQYDPATQRLAQLAVVDARRPLHFATRQYDHLNRLARITYHNGVTQGAFRAHSDFHCQRDAFGRVAGATMRDGSHWRYSYHASGELAQARRHADTSSPTILAGHSFTWSYDSIGNRTSSRRDLAEPGTSPDTAYLHNGLNQLTSTRAPGSIDVTGVAPAEPEVLVNGIAASRQGFFFHRRLQVDNGPGPVWQEVTVAQGQAARTGRRLVPPATSHYHHDEDGNLTGNTLFNFTWDAGSRLTAVETSTHAVAAGIPYRRIRYAYDSGSRLVQRLEFDAPLPGSPTRTTRYLYAGWRCLGELDETDSLQRTYTWGLDNNDTLHLGDGNAALLWIHDHRTRESHLTTNDANGNITGLVSATSGEPTATYSYSPFGRLLTSTGPYANNNPFRFSTKPQDPTTGLYYYGYRHYNPATGSWISRDPIAEEGGLNLYGFVGNNPMGTYDLLGLDSFSSSGQPNRVLGFLGDVAHVLHESVGNPGQLAGAVHRQALAQGQGQGGALLAGALAFAGRASGLLNIAELAPGIDGRFVVGPNGELVLEEFDNLNDELLYAGEGQLKFLASAAGARTLCPKQIPSARPTTPSHRTGREILGIANHRAGRTPTLKRREIEAITGLKRIGAGRIRFDGFEVRSVRDLSHLTDNQLRFLLSRPGGRVPTARAPGRSDPLILHHHRQRVTGPIIEIPDRFHLHGIGKGLNPRQHPLGRNGGIGSKSPARIEFNAWRERYWEARYRDEALLRGLSL